MFPGYLTSAQAATHLGIAPSTLRVLARRSNGFPRPERVSNVLFWRVDELDAWRAEHPARRQAGTTSACTSGASSPAQQPSADGAIVVADDGRVLVYTDDGDPECRAWAP